MSKPSYTEYKSEDVFQQMLDSVSRLLLWGGIAATVGTLGFLIFTYSSFSGMLDTAKEAQALSNIGILGKILIAGVVSLAAATTFMFWGEETLAILQLVFGAGLYFAPLYVPSAFGGSNNRVTGEVLTALQNAGAIFGAIAVLVLVADISNRVRIRSQEGSRAEQLKYGKGVKEERDIQNVFLGKCWQLPFCRKFVRERCPIYHSRRTCWKERVGCMCEEQVIRGAMENKPIPKDQVLAAKFIPQNTRLTENQKAERCKACVIYNEHQKHKYKLMLPVTIAFFVGFYLLFRGPLLDGTAAMVQKLNVMMGKLALDKANLSNTHSGVFEEILLAAFMIVAFAYAMKMLEFLVFKLKV